jgi:sirohydrochlorin ferrochelatase
MSYHKKALILVDHGSKVREANDLLVDITNIIGNKNNTGFDIVTYSHMELAEPTIEQAYEHCIKNGAKEIIVHPYFLAPGRHSKKDIPEMVEKVARKHPDVKYYVTEPLGIHEKIIEVILERSRLRDAPNDL